MINNKLILASAFLVCFAYVVYADAPEGGGYLMRKSSREFMQQCEKEIGITLPEMHNSNEDNEKVLCFSKCLATKERLLSADGVINIDQVKETLAANPEKIKNIDNAISCLEDVGPVSSCQDMSKVRACFKP